MMAIVEQLFCVIPSNLDSVMVTTVLYVYPFHLCNGHDHTGYMEQSIVTRAHRNTHIHESYIKIVAVNP